MNTLLLADFWSITFLVILLVISPGPAFAITVDNSLHYGRFPGIITAFGIMLGDLFHITLNLVGLSFILVKFPEIMRALQFMGALYFLFLGIQLIRHAHKGLSPRQFKNNIPSSNNLPNQKNHPAPQSYIKDGLLVGMMNPKACLFYLNFFSVMLPITLSTPHRALLGLWILVIVFLWFSFVALTLGHKKLRNHFIAYQSWIKRLCGLALLYFGGLLLWEETLSLLKTF